MFSVAEHKRNALKPNFIVTTEFPLDEREEVTKHGQSEAQCYCTVYRRRYLFNAFLEELSEARIMT
jgi:hypothetical protein